MTDKRAESLVKLISSYSLNIERGEKVLIIGNEVAKDFVSLLQKEIENRGAVPVLAIIPKDREFNLINCQNKKEITEHRNNLLKIAKTTNSVIDIENEFNDYSLLPAKKLERYNRIMKPLWGFLIFDRQNYKRVTVLLPLEKEAKEAKMSLGEFEDFVYSCCFLDWEKLTERFQKINNLLRETNEVHLSGENIDLKFSVKGRMPVMENGRENMPGGEIYTAPIKNSLQGYVKFDYPAVRDGLEVGGIFLKFKNGRVTDFSATKNEKFLKSLLHTDRGARYIGEFGIGINPEVKSISGSWIDEKIEGTIHLALGKAYDENVKSKREANNSAIHWDLVKDMKKGKIVLDNKIIQENGKWTI